MSPPLETLVLAKLACAPEGLPASQLRDDLAPLVGKRLAAAEWKRTLAELTAGLQERGLVETVGRGRVRLTRGGRAEVDRRLPGLDAEPSWKAVSDRLVAVALGEREARAVATADALRASVLARAHGVPAAVARKSGARLLDALTAKALGLPMDRPLRKSDLQRHLLAPLLGGRPVADLGQVVALLAARELGARRTDGRALRTAALERFVFGEPAAAAAPVASAPVATTPAPSLREFAERVLTAARASAPEARFGSDKVFVCELWRALKDSSGATGEADFKRRLGEAQREGHLKLSRADLGDLMDAEKVRASELRFDNAVFHFVRL